MAKKAVFEADNQVRDWGKLDKNQLIKVLRRNAIIAKQASDLARENRELKERIEQFRIELATTRMHLEDRDLALVQRDTLHSEAVTRLRSEAAAYQEACAAFARGIASTRHKC